jgi:hypothetical protein
MKGNLFKQVIYIAIPVLAVSGCSRTAEMSFRNYAVNFSHVEELPLTEMASDIRKIQLETGDDILISHIMDVIDTGEHLFVFHLQRCSMFDRTGKYLRDIGSKGEGPQQYLSLRNMFVKGDSVFLHDSHRHKLMVFASDGTFVRAIQLPDGRFETLPLQNDMYLLFTPSVTGTETDKFVFFDESGEKNKLPYPQERKNSVPNTIMVFYNEGKVFHYDGKDYFKEMFDGTVFTVHADYTLSPRFVLDFGPYSTSLEKRYTFSGHDNMWKEMVSVKIAGESASHLFFQALLDEKTYSFYIDKQRQTLHNVSFTLPEELALEKPFVPSYVSEDNRRLIGVMEAEDDKNPCLVVATLK